MKQLFDEKFFKADLVVLRIVCIYLLFGLFWIYFSDSLLMSIAVTPAAFKRISIYKGWAYIFITSMLLYWLFRKTLRQRSSIESSLQVSEERWKFALEGAGHGVWDWNVQTDEVFRSARWCEIYGYAENEVAATAQAGRQLIHPDDLPTALADIDSYLEKRQGCFVSEFRLKCRDGSWKWTLSRGMLFSSTDDGKPLRMIGTHTDISERKRSEEQIFRLAHYDVVTGLPNRVLFHDRFDQDIRKSERSHQPITLMYLDLDRFKEVNDTLGHDMGDLLLQEAAKRLLSCVRGEDTVARIGGDEFAILLDGMNEAAGVERVAQQTLQALAAPFHLRREVVYITASIGISMYPEDGRAVDILLKNADQAMYEAKNHGRNGYHYFTPSMQQAALARMRTASDLRVALADNQFRLYYQPIVELACGSIHKAEALIRWQHPVRGLVSPLEFIPIAEDAGLIHEIGDWVFNQAAEQVRALRAHDSAFQISVNKSPLQFKGGHHGHVNWLEHLQKLGLPGQSIAVEITEGLLLEARSDVVNQLVEFRQAGIQIAIDDFGTGYSSLAYLRKFEIDYVKIDRSFTSHIAAGSSNMVLCEAIIVMAHKLGMKVIAEGIETRQQHELLLAAGCDYGQGYLFAQPLPADEFIMLVKSGLPIG